jgi:hypothetical protein
MSFCRTSTIGVILIATNMASSAKLAIADDEAIEFWFSTSGSAPPGPEAPELELSIGASDELFIWCRPETGARLRNFSLNVVTLQSGLDLVDGSFTIFNSAGAGLERFEFTTDSSFIPPLVSEYSEADVATGDVDSVLNLQGFTIIPAAGIVGMGPICGAGEIGCEIADDGDPAWLLGSVTVKAVTAGATIDLHLQVGEFGMHQEIFPNGDYDFGGLVNNFDYDLWRSVFGAPVDSAADGNGDGAVNAADYVVWRNNVGATSTVPPTSQVSVKFGLDTTPLTPPVLYNAASDRDITLMGDEPDAVVSIAGPGAGSVVTASTPEPATFWLVMSCLVAVTQFRLPRGISANREVSRQPRL